MVRHTVNYLLLVILTVLFLPGHSLAQEAIPIQYQEVENLEKVVKALKANKDHQFKAAWVFIGDSKVLDSSLQSLSPVQPMNQETGIKVLYIPEKHEQKQGYLGLLLERVSPGDQGLYSSLSTKRLGIVTFKDLELQRQGENRLFLTPIAEPIEFLQESRVRMEKINAERFWILGLLCVFSLSWVVAVFILRQVGVFIPIMLLTSLLSPAMVLIWDQAIILDWYIRFPLALVSGGIVSYILWNRCGRGVLASTSTVGLINLFIFALDALQGGPLLKASVLGPDPLIGARFYGFGNEAAAILIFNALLTINGFQWWKADHGYYVTLSLLTIPCILLLHPTWGANVGASLTALIILFISPIFLGGRSFTWGRILLIVLTAIGLVALAGFLDLWIDGKPSWHLTDILFGGTAQGVWEIFLRKLEMVRTIFAATFLTWIALGLYLLYTVGLFWESNRVGQFLKSDVVFYQWQRLLTIGGWVIFLTNDSGLVALIIMFVLNLCFLALWFQQEKVHTDLVERRDNAWNIPG